MQVSAAQQNTVKLSNKMRSACAVHILYTTPFIFLCHFLSQKSSPNNLFLPINLFRVKRGEKYRHSGWVFVTVCYFSSKVWTLFSGNLEFCKCSVVSEQHRRDELLLPCLGNEFCWCSPALGPSLKESCTAFLLHHFSSSILIKKINCQWRKKKCNFRREETSQQTTLLKLTKM